MRPAPVNGEVTIRCLTDEVHLRDLGIRLTRGNTTTIPLSRAMGSRDLSSAKIDGTVSAQTLRSSVIRAQEMVSSDTTTSQSPRHLSAPTVDLNPVMDAILYLTESVAALRQEVAALRQKPDQTLDLTPVLVALQGLSPKLSGITERVPQPHKDPAPQEDVIFIPSNITGNDLSTNLNVTASSETNSGVEDATQALKDARKKAKGIR